jgi:PAS domain S-box-containing protein
MIYGLDESEAVAHLQATAGISVSPVAPPTIALRETLGTWSLGSVAQSSQPVVIDGLSSQFGSLPTGAWNVAPQSAMVFPLVLPGQERPRAIMVAAVSPMRALDESYRTFFGLVATQIAAGLADAQALAEERKRAEALAELDRAKTAFFSNVSHEFRTPLTLMLGPLAESIADPKTPPEVKERLQVSHRNGLRLLKLVNSLLDFSRIEAGRIQAVYEPTDLSALTAELASNFRSACAEAGLKLLVHCETVTESTYVDCEMWEKIVLNLISNAFKYTLAGEIEVALRQVRESGAKAGFVELSVRDTGIGISEHELPKIFQRFYRIENARGRTHEGTGIGLSLVQELVALHGGTITVESVFGQGSQFKVRIPMGYAHLPAARIKASAPRTAASTRISAEAYVKEAMRWLPRAAEENEEDSVLTMPTDGLIRAGHGARIIIADDNVDMRDYIRRLLAPNYRVETVADGGAALEAARREKPDLIVADVMMPVMDGFGLLRSVREDQELQTVPVIMLSARAGEESKVEGLAAGADDYLVKPFSARELLARVDAQLQMASVRGQTEKMLRQSEERFRTMADSSPMMIWMTDPAGKILFVNRTGAEFLGVTAEQAGDLDYVQFIHPDDRDAYLTAFREALDRRQTFHHRVRLQRFDGEWRWFESRGNPIFDGAGNMTGFIGSSPDITEIYQSQQALRELGQRKDEFLANMSHEIRSPLTAIMGYTDILLTRLEDPEDIACLRTIKESGDYLIEIINDILDLAKIEAGKLVLNCEPVSIHALLSEVQSLMNGRAKQKDLSLVLRYDGPNRGGLSIGFWIQLIASLAVFTGIMFYIIPKVTAWFFQKLESEKTSHYIFVLSVVFFSAFLAELAGVEPIIGAFVAGLALNKLIPYSSTLMNRIEFIGQSIFIPFFLISVGMLVDVKVLLNGPAAVIIAVTLSVVALIGKWLAATTMSYAYRYTSDQRRLIFGLSSSHAAATLAVILVGFQTRIIDENALNGTILLILVTCLAATIITENASRQILTSEKDEPIIKGTSLEDEHILIPLANLDNMDKILDFAIFLKNTKSPNPVTILSVVPNNEEAEKNLIKAKQNLQSLVKSASANETKVNIIATIDHNIGSGIIRTSVEVMADTIIIGWPRKTSIIERFIETKASSIISQTSKSIYICHFATPLTTYGKMVVICPPLAELEPGFEVWVSKISVLSRELSLDVYCYCDVKSKEAINWQFTQRKLNSGFIFSDEFDLDNIQVLQSHVAPEDLVIFIAARRASVSYDNSMENIQEKMEKYFNPNSKIIIYPRTYQIDSKYNEYGDINPEPLNQGIEKFQKLGKDIGNLLKRDHHS